MARIRQLPALVVNKIAAGEVIERPASVLKELLENSFDAGARRIDVEVDQGGVELIRVVDDGGGIHADDLPLAFASHATSKLHDADDLFRVRTLGFRGEALASIGGVAQVTLQSRPPDETSGAEIVCNGGDLGAVRPWNGAPGTRIEVKHLFFNTPVRRKFLRTTPTEMGHLSEAFTRLALAHSRTDGTAPHLTLRHNNKPIYDLPPSMSPRDRIGAFFGLEVAGALYAVDRRAADDRLNGYIADPSCERGTVKMQYLIVNGRWVRDRTLGHAVQEAYRGLLMTGRYAVVFLFVDLPPDLVDVNVHPTKAEVRFRDSQALYHLVFSTVRDRLSAENLTARLHAPSTMRPTAETWSLSPPPPSQPSLPFPGRAPTPSASIATAFSSEQLPSPPDDPSAPAASAPDLPELPPTLPSPGSNKVIQLYDAYLVMETEKGMLVIDQHALHERILFDQLQRRLRSGRLESQKLLIPEPVELTAEQAARALEHREALAELGLGVEDFGGGTVLLTSVPTLLSRRPPQTILLAVVDHLTAQDRPPTREVLFNDLLSLMACHAAARAGDRLTPEQIAALVEQRALADDVHHCPHGRPTSLLFSRHDLDRQFRRV